MANKANNTARKPAASKAASLPALVPGAPVASKLPATGAPALPMGTNAAGYVALIAALPAVAVAIASKAGKYGQGAGLVPSASVVYTLTPAGNTMGATGHGKNGKPNVQAAICMAAKLASAATGGGPVCGAAIAYHALSNATVLALLQASKATQYVGRSATPCPAWVSGYITGNARAIPGLFARQ